MNHHYYLYDGGRQVDNGKQRSDFNGFPVRTNDIDKDYKHELSWYNQQYKETCCSRTNACHKTQNSSQTMGHFIFP